MGSVGGGAELVREPQRGKRCVVDVHDAQARALHQLAVLHSHLRRDRVLAERLLAEAEGLWLALGDRRKAFARLRNRAQCWQLLGRVDEALSCFEHCARVARDEGDVIGQIDSLLSLSTLQTQRRQWTAALASDREAMRLAWRHRHRHGLRDLAGAFVGFRHRGGPIQSQRPSRDAGEPKRRQNQRQREKRAHHGVRPK